MDLVSRAISVLGILKVEAGENRCLARASLWMKVCPEFKDEITIVPVKPELANNWAMAGSSAWAGRQTKAINRRMKCFIMNEFSGKSLFNWRNRHFQRRSAIVVTAIDDEIYSAANGDGRGQVEFSGITGFP